MDALDSSKDRESGRHVKVAERYEQLRSALTDVVSGRMDALVERIEMQDLETVLRKAIADSGMTHYAIAKQAGISPVVLDRFKAGKTITLATASKITEILVLTLMKVDGEVTASATASKSMLKKTTKRISKK